MATQVQQRRGTTAQHSTFTGAVGEITVDTDKDVAVVHDGSTAGGVPLLRQDLSNLPAGTIDNADINASAAIVDTKLATISTADKVSLSALNIDGGTDIGTALADSDLFIVDDGGAGTNRKAAATRITDYAFGKVSGDITINSSGVAAIGSGVIVSTDLADDAVTFAKIQNITSGRLLGRTTASAGDTEEISTGIGLSLASGTLTAIPREKSITIESPTASEKIAMFYTTAAITVSSIRSVIIGSTSVTFSIRYGTDLSGAGTEVVTGGTVANTTSSVLNTTSFNSASIPADRLVWITTSALSGTPTQLHVTVVF